MSYLESRLSIAPMMDCTDRHYRYFMRLLTQHTWLYTEMVTAQAVKHGDRDYLLDYSQQEHPLVLQLGGSDPELLALATTVATEHYAYDEINLNVGCPSDRVQAGRFGACLMLEPELVRDCVQAMIEASPVPITVKCRIGVDDQDDYQDLIQFIKIITQAPVKKLIIHARKAWLQGLSPRENRNIPPLNYPLVYRIKKEFPNLHIGINGGVNNLAEALDHLQYVDEVMVGRLAYSHPYVFAAADQRIYGDKRPVISRHAAIEAYMPYVEEQLAQGVPLRRLARFLVGVFHQQPGARQWRRYLSEQAGINSIDVLHKALKLVAGD